MGQAEHPGTEFVTTKDGGRGRLLKSAEGGFRVHFDDGEELALPSEAVIVEDGELRLPYTREELRQGATPLGPVVIPLAKEEVKIGKRRVDKGGVRIRKIVRERDEVIDEPLVHEKTDVKRVPINRFVDKPLPTRQDGDTTIIPLVEEVLVVEKRFRLKEELHITRTRVETRKPASVRLRSEDVEIERIDARHE